MVLYSPMASFLVLQQENLVWDASQNHKVGGADV